MKLIASILLACSLVFHPVAAQAQDGIDGKTLLIVAGVGATAYGLHLADGVADRHLVWAPSAQPLAAGASDVTVGAGLALGCAFDRTVGCLKREALRVGVAVGVTELVKRTIHRERPDKTDTKSFFSEHTTLACVGGFTSKETIAATALCAATGYLRVAAHRHWFTDVLVGAGTGFLLSRIDR